MAGKNGPVQFNINLLAGVAQQLPDNPLDFGFAVAPGDGASSLYLGLQSTVTVPPTDPSTDGFPQVVVNFNLATNTNQFYAICANDVELQVIGA